MVGNAQRDSSQYPPDFLSVMCIGVGFEFGDDGADDLQSAPAVAPPSGEPALTPYEV